MFRIKPAPSEYKSLEPRWVRFLEGFVLHNWWVILIVLMLGLCFEASMDNFKIEYDKLKLYESELEKKKADALNIQKDLQLRVDSQSDPTYIELTLMKGLGLVPEGYKKIYFSHDNH